MSWRDSCEAPSIFCRSWRTGKMLFGHNSNVQAGGTNYHVQTEDRGTTNALIDTTVYFNGRVLHRRTNNYFDLLPLNPGREHARSEEHTSELQSPMYLV